MSQGFGGDFGQPMQSPGMGPGAVQGVMVQKPSNDIYTVLLGLSLVFILIAIISLLAIWGGTYEWDTTPSDSPVASLGGALDAARATVHGMLC